MTGVDSAVGLEVLLDAGAEVSSLLGLTGWYHVDSSPTPPDLIRNASGQSGLGKPGGALWLSPGAMVDGSVRTEWLNWSVKAGFGDDDSFVHEVVFGAGSLLTLTDEVVMRLGVPFIEPSEFAIPGLSYGVWWAENRVNWQAVMKAGVDAVRVDGSQNRSALHGWDVDSIAVLRGSVVKGWKNCEVVGVDTGTKNSAGVDDAEASSDPSRIHEGERR